jgi:hypothetical protein
MSNLIIDGAFVSPPNGLVIKNFMEDGLYRFINKKRPAIPPNTRVAVNAVVVHETVTNSHEETVAVLKQRGLGVHFIADADGTIYQHADAFRDDMWHGSQFNELSVGIETVTPYNPGFAGPVAPWKDVIDAPWAYKGKYVLPTPSQAEAVAQLVNFLTSAEANPIAIPQLWPGFQHTHKLSMGRVAADVRENPGIHAHIYFGHADGGWLVLYTWLRLEPGLSPEDAYTKAKALATGAHSAGIDLDSYFQDNPYLET